MQLKPGVCVSAEDTKFSATTVPKISTELVNRAPGARIDVSQKPLPIATFVAFKKLNEHIRHRDPRGQRCKRPSS